MPYQKNVVLLDKKHIDLSSAKHLDYNFLGQLIEKTSYIETIILPKLNASNAEEVLSVLDESTAKNTTLTEIKLNLSGNYAKLPRKMATFYERIQSRLKRNRKRIFAIHGGGNIGLGCMADIISRSSLNYTIKATSSDRFMNSLINSAHRYCLQNSANKKITAHVENVHMIYSREVQNVIKLYMSANLLALCLTEEAFLAVVDQIAQGLLARYEYDAAELKILILMNKPQSDKFVRKTIEDALLKQTNNAAYTEEVLAAVKFVPTVVDRIVSKVNRKGVLSQLKQQLKAVDTLHSASLLRHYSFIENGVPFSNQLDHILNTPEKLAKAVLAFNLQVALFNVEEKFSLHLPDGLPETRRLPLVKPVKNLKQYEAIKNKFINGPHAILAWAGGLMGCETIAEAMKKPSLVYFIKKLMDKEIAPILKAEYPNLTAEELINLKNDFLQRCTNNHADTIRRVGRDPLRKLNQGGRVRGVIELCQKHHLNIETIELERGIAAGILYAINNIDPDNAECKKIREIYERNHSYEAVLCYKGRYGNAHYPGFEAKKDKKIIRNIVRQISLLERTFKLQRASRQDTFAFTVKQLRKNMN